MSSAKARCAWATVSLLSLLAGCAPTRIGGSTPVDQVIDGLRRDNQTLTTRVADQDHKLALQQDQIDVLRQQVATTRPSMAGINPADLPRLVGVEFEDYSGPVSGPDGMVLRLYVRPFDQRGRFIPLWVKAAAEAVWIRPGLPPLVLAQAGFAPAQFDQAYREGFTGIHYTLDLPLASLPAGVNRSAVKLVVTDVATGVSVSCQSTMLLAPSIAATRPAR
jgi:hypothetical protein